MSSLVCKAKYLAYTEANMKACLLDWCMCTDPSEKVESIIQAEMRKTYTEAVDRSTLYRFFKKTVDLGVDAGGPTNLKEIQASVRVLARSTHVLLTIEPAMAALKSIATAVIEELYKSKKAKQKAHQRDLHEGNCVMTRNQEEYLVQFCKILAHSGQGLSRKEVLQCMNIISSCDISRSQNAVDGFFKRNPSLKLKGSSGIDPQRSSQANEHVRDAFFSKLDAYVEVLYAMGKMKWKSFSEIPSKFIYNMDELASDTTKRRDKIATDRDSSLRTFTITPEGDRMPFHVTVCLTTRADGLYVSDGGIKEGAPPPVIIHSKSVSTKAKAASTKASVKSKVTSSKEGDSPYKVSSGHLTGLVLMEECATIEEAYEKNNDFGFLVLSTPNGSMKQDTMLPFAKHFVANLSKHRDPLEGIILLMDGHSSRWDLPALHYFYKNNVFPFFLPSHTSIWSQPNDNGPNKRLHTLIEAAAVEQRRSYSLRNMKTFKPRDWNKVFFDAWKRYLQAERADYCVTLTNTAINAFLKTGIFPFNPRCPSWTDSIANLGISSVAQNQRFLKSYELRPRSGGAVILDAKESAALFDCRYASSMVLEEGGKAIRVALQRAKKILAFFRVEYDIIRANLLQSIHESSSVLSGDSSASVRKESEFDTDQKELLKKLQCLRPEKFAISEGDHIALKLVAFVPCSIDSISMPLVISEKEVQRQYIRNVLDQTPHCHGVVVERLGELGGCESTGTATKIGTDLWMFFTENKNGEISSREVSTHDLVNADLYKVLEDTLSSSATEGQRRQQKEAKRRREKEQERRREQTANEMAIQGRNKMLREEYEKLAAVISSGRSYEYNEFLDMVTKVGDPFECEVVIEGQRIVAIANEHKQGILNLTMHDRIVDKLYSGKRPSDSYADGNTSKRRNTGRYVPTKNSDDGISAVEILEGKDLEADMATRRKEKKNLEKEHGVQEKFISELKRYQQKRQQDFFLVKDSSAKTHVTLIYRLFGGERYSTRKVPEMLAYLKPLRIDAESSNARIAALDQNMKRMIAELEAIPAISVSDEPDEPIIIAS
jgi:hypothetical protein